MVINGLFMVSLFGIMLMGAVVGWLGRSELQRRRDAEAEARREARRLQYAEGRQAPRHHSTAGHAVIRPVRVSSETSDQE